MKKMMFALAALSLLLFALGCATGAGAGNATHYRLLTDPDALREFDVMKVPTGWFAAATATADGKLTWNPKLSGGGKTCADGKDVLSLNDGKVYAAGDTTRPAGPHVTGCVATNGVFTPSSSEVVQ
jgi:hypothetical protein